ncbi:DUF2637 domain-containing protein, partial [Streptomyces sp. NPDC058583]|uniref:DUF2637 domain-containing protein n=1 Tax=unclassified Streptomyces TaxID=2593676 RepID=UPI0036569981
MTHPHDPTDRRPSEGAAEQYVLVAAGAVIVALTIASFWLSYAHLAEVAGQHGLGGSLTRQWAWPGTVDAFIITGELLMLRAGLRRETDGWAIGLTITGSVGSIALNVAGVHGSTEAAVPLLDYIVAAVPPTAALLAFGVLMRQIHQLVAPRSQQGESPATTAAPGTGTVADCRQDTPKQSTPDAEVTQTGTASPHEGDGPNADSLVPFAGLEKATVDGDGPHTISATVPFPKHEEEAAGPHAQEQGIEHRSVPAGNGPLSGAGAATTSSQDNPPSSRQRAILKSLARGDRPEHEHAVPGTGLEQPLPHPVPEDRPDNDGDPGLNGDRPD